jgi:hypothetical protein
MSGLTIGEKRIEEAYSVQSDFTNPQTEVNILNHSISKNNNLGLFSTCQLTLSEDIRGIIIKNKLSEIKEIEHIYYTPDDRVLYVWIVLNSADKEVRKKIYTSELEIIDSFKSYDFEENLDFYIIFRQDKPIEGLFSEADDTRRIRIDLEKKDIAIHA